MSTAHLDERVQWLYEGGDVEALRAVRQSVTTPEEMAACPRYQKTLHGPLAVMEIGIDAIRAQCPHFNEWLVRLEAI